MTVDPGKAPREGTPYRTLRERAQWYMDSKSGDVAMLVPAETVMALLDVAEAANEADSYLGDPAGHPLDAINLARGVLREPRSRLDENKPQTPTDES